MSSIYTPLTITERSPDGFSTPDFSSYNDWSVDNANDSDELNNRASYADYVRKQYIANGNFDDPQNAAQLEQSIRKNTIDAAIADKVEGATERMDSMFAPKAQPIETKLAFIKQYSDSNSQEWKSADTYLAHQTSLIQSGAEGNENPLTEERTMQYQQEAEELAGGAAYQKALRAAVDRGDMAMARLTDENGQSYIHSGKLLDTISFKDAMQQSVSMGGMSYSDAASARSLYSVDEKYNEPYHKVRRWQEQSNVLEKLSLKNKDLGKSMQGLQALYAEMEDGVDKSPEFKAKEEAAIAKVYESMISTGAYDEDTVPDFEDISNAASNMAQMNNFYNGDAEAAESEDVGKNIQRIGYNNLVMHPAAMLNKKMFDASIKANQDLTPSEISMLNRRREFEKEQNFADYNERLANDSVVGDKWITALQIGRTNGQKDADTLDLFINDEDNYSSAKGWLSGIWSSVEEGISDLAAAVGVMTGNTEWALPILQQNARDKASRREMSALFGKEYGFGRNAVEMLAPVLTDMAATALLSIPTAGAGGAGYLIAKQGATLTAKGIAKGLVTNTFRRGATNASGVWVRESAEEAAERLVTMNLIKGSSESVKLKGAKEALDSFNNLTARRYGVDAAVFVPAATRSGGMTYGSVYTQLQQDNPDATHEENHDKAMGAAMQSGLMTGITTLAFGKLGFGGVEDALVRGATYGQLKRVLEPFVKKTGTTFDKAVTGAYKDALKQTGMFGLRTGLAKAGLKGTTGDVLAEGIKGAVSEAPEEALQEFIDGLISDAATDSETPFAERISQSFNAALYGAVLGGGITSGKSLVTAGNQLKIDQQVAPQMLNSFEAKIASKLEESGSPLMAEQVRNVLRSTADTQVAAFERARQEYESDQEQAPFMDDMPVDQPAEPQPSPERVAVRAELEQAELDFEALAEANPVEEGAEPNPELVAQEQKVNDLRQQELDLAINEQDAAQQQATTDEEVEVDEDPLDALSEAEQETEKRLRWAEANIDEGNISNVLDVTASRMQDLPLEDTAAIYELVSEYDTELDQDETDKLAEIRSYLDQNTTTPEVGVTTPQQPEGAIIDFAEARKKLSQDKTFDQLDELMTFMESLEEDGYLVAEEFDSIAEVAMNSSPREAAVILDDLLKQKDKTVNFPDSSTQDPESRIKLTPQKQPVVSGSTPVAEVPVLQQEVDYNTDVARLPEFAPPADPSLQNSRNVEDPIASKSIGERGKLVSGASKEGDIIDPEKRTEQFESVGYETQQDISDYSMDDQAKLVSTYGMSTLSKIRSAKVFNRNGAHFMGGVTVDPDLDSGQAARVIAHELGHAAHSLLGDAINKDPAIQSELQVIEETLYPNLREAVAGAKNVDNKFFNYLLSSNELIAEFNALRIKNPDLANQIAPTLTSKLQSVDRDPDLVIDRRTVPTIIGRIEQTGERLTFNERDGLTFRQSIPETQPTNFGVRQMKQIKRLLDGDASVGDFKTALFLVNAYVADGGITPERARAVLSMFEQRESSGKIDLSNLKPFYQTKLDNIRDFASVKPEEDVAQPVEQEVGPLGEGDAFIKTDEDGLVARLANKTAVYDQSAKKMYGLGSAEAVVIPPTIANTRLGPYITLFDRVRRYGETSYEVIIKIPNFGHTSIGFSGFDGGATSIKELAETLDGGDYAVWREYANLAPDIEAVLDRDYEGNRYEGLATLFEEWIQGNGVTVNKFKSQAADAGRSKEQIMMDQHRSTYGKTARTMLQAVASSPDSKFAELSQLILENHKGQYLDAKLEYNANRKRAAGGTNAGILVDTGFTPFVGVHEYAHVVTQTELDKNQFYLPHTQRRDGKYWQGIKEVAAGRGIPDKKNTNEAGGVSIVYKPHGVKPTEYQQEIARLYDLAKQTVPQITKAGENPDPTIRQNRKLPKDQQVPHHVAYGLGNLHEFVAQALSSSDMQEFLNNIPDPEAKGKTLLDRFMDAIANIMGIPVDRQSVLASTLKATNDIGLADAARTTQEAGSTQSAPEVEQQQFTNADFERVMGEVAPDDMVDQEAAEADPTLQQPFDEDPFAQEELDFSDMTLSPEQDEQLTLFQEETNRIEDQTIRAQAETDALFNDRTLDSGVNQVENDWESDLSRDEILSTVVEKAIPYIRDRTPAEIDIVIDETISAPMSMEGTTMTINPWKIGNEIAKMGGDGSNTGRMLDSIMSEENAHFGGFMAFDSAKVDEMAAAVGVDELSSVAQQYYNENPAMAEESIKKLRSEDPAVAKKEAATMVEEQLRMKLQRATRGFTTEEDVLFLRTNPSMLAMTTRYFEGGINRIAANFDLKTNPNSVVNVQVNNMVAQLRSIKARHRVGNAVMTFNPNNPNQGLNTMLAMQAETENIEEQLGMRDLATSVGSDQSNLVQAKALGQVTELVSPNNRILFTSVGRPSITAWHGTPHKIDKFSANNIGTGEGAQVFGWGLYFAEDKEVAKSYLGAGRDYGKSVDAHVTALTANMGGVENAIKFNLERMETRRKDGGDMSFLSRVQTALETGQGEGSLYQVELNVEQDELLDWDKPITKEQAAFIESIDENYREGLDEVINYEPYTELKGSEFYWFLKKTASEGGVWLDQDSEDMAEVVSRGLSKMGIKGVKYLDGDSRKAGEGTYNYVIFNDADIKITTENGTPVEPLAISQTNERSASTSVGVGFDFADDFIEAANELTNIGPQASTQLGGFDTSFHFTTKVKHILSGYGFRRLNKLIERHQKSGNKRAETSISEKLTTKEGELKFLRQKIADYVSNIPNRRATDLRTGEMVDPRSVLLEYFPDGEAGHLEQDLLDIAAVVDSSGASKQDVHNLMELMQNEGVEFSSKFEDDLSNWAFGKGKAEFAQANKEALASILNQEFNDVTDMGNGAFLSTRIDPTGERSASTSVGKGKAKSEFSSRSFDFDFQNKIFEVPMLETGGYNPPTNIFAKYVLGDPDVRLTRLHRVYKALERQGGTTVKQFDHTFKKLLTETYGDDHKQYPHEDIATAIGSNAGVSVPQEILNDLEEQLDQNLRAVDDDPTLEYKDKKLAKQVENQLHQNRVEEAMNAEAQKMRAEQRSAMERIQKDSPDLARHMHAMRTDLIDTLSGLLKDDYNLGGALGIKVDANMGIYITRSYKMFSEIGYRDKLRQSLITNKKAVDAFLGEVDTSNMTDEEVENLLAESKENYDEVQQEGIEFFEQATLDNISTDPARIKAFMDEGMSEADAQAEAYVTARDVILTPAYRDASYNAMLQFVDEYANPDAQNIVASTAGYKVLMDNLRQKKDIPEQLRKVLGENTDQEQGVNNLLRTYATVFSMVNRQSFLRNIVTVGTAAQSPNPKLADKFLLTPAEYQAAKAEDPEKYDLWRPVRGDAKVSEFDPLGNYWGPPDMIDHLNAMTKPYNQDQNMTSNEKLGDSLTKFLHKLTGLSMATKTLGSVSWAQRNMIGNLTVFPMMNGWFRPDKIMKQAKLVWRKRNADEAYAVDAEIQELVGLDILDSNMRMTIMKDLLRGTGDVASLQEEINELTSQEEKLESAGRTGKAWDKTKKIGTRVAELGDSIDGFYKMAYFYNELEVLKAAKKKAPEGTPLAAMSDYQLKQEAANKVNRTSQSASYRVAIAQKLSSSPLGLLIAPFIGFTADMFRVPVGIFKVANEEMESGNAVLRKRGIKRMFGLIGTLATTAALPTVFAQLFGGLDDEDRTTLGEALPPFLKGHSIYYFKMGDELKQIDLTYTNPVAMIVDPSLRGYENLVKGEYSKATVAMLKGYIGDTFMNEQILAGTVGSWWRNKDELTGKPIYDERLDSFGEIARKTFKHIYEKAYEPDTFKRLLLAGQRIGGDTEGIPANETALGVLASGLKPAKWRDVDLQKEFTRLVYAEKEAKSAVRDNLNGVFRKRPMSEETIADFYRDYYENEHKLNTRMHKFVKSFMNMGLEEGYLRNALVKSGYGKRRVQALFAGYTERPSLTPQMMKNLEDRELINRAGTLYQTYMQSPEFRQIE